MGAGSGSSKGSAADQKVYRAKLGESKMKLYYDKELGKWVNPDNPDAGAAQSATPPPPRTGGTPAPPMNAGPPRPPMSSTPVPSFPTSYPTTPALGSGLPSGPPSRVGTPAHGHGPGPSISSYGPGAGTPLMSMGPPTMSNLTLPPRPGTSASNASSIDDLYGPPTGRKAGAKAKKGGKGRYIDVMAK